MSNFTKSILYSTTVLAAGLVAIFAIYNNVTTDQSGSSLAQITPAAGEESSVAAEYDQVMNEGADMASEAAEATTAAVLGAAETVGSAINGAVDTAEETLAEAGETATETLNNIAPAAGEEEAAPSEEATAETVEGEEEEVAEDAPAEAVEGEEEATTEEHSAEETEEEHTDHAH